MNTKDIPLINKIIEILNDDELVGGSTDADKVVMALQYITPEDLENGSISDTEPAF